MRVSAHGSRKSVAPQADTFDYVTWTKVGPYTVGLRASRIELIEDSADAAPGCPIVDLAALLGAPEETEPDPDAGRVVKVVARPAYALRIPGRVSLTGPTPDALLDLPLFLSELRVTPGIEALSVRGDGFGFVLDLDRLGERVPEATLRGEE